MEPITSKLSMRFVKSWASRMYGWNQRTVNVWGLGSNIWVWSFHHVCMEWTRWCDHTSFLCVKKGVGAVTSICLPHADIVVVHAQDFKDLIHFLLVVYSCIWIFHDVVKEHWNVFCYPTKDYVMDEALPSYFPWIYGSEEFLDRMAQILGPRNILEAYSLPE